tara:strand:- start:3257 stop:3487 length:231 start_codon:yes stop_codon:yes gene_type:complete
MKNLLIEQEKFDFIKYEYVEQLDLLCGYDLVMYLLDDSLFVRGDKCELLQLCNQIYDYDTTEEVNDAYETWIENNQ